MSNERITSEIVARFLKSSNPYEVYDFATIDDAAAKSLISYAGSLFLSGLTSLSDAAAASLSTHNLYLPELTRDIDQD